MMSGGWGVEAAALLAGLVVATVMTPAGVSGAVRLLPFHVSVLGTPSPAGTPTNLLYKVVPTLGGLWRYWQQGQRVGSVIRVELLPDRRPFQAVVALVLVPTGLWLLLGHTRSPSAPQITLPTGVLVTLAAGIGCVGGIRRRASALRAGGRAKMPPTSSETIGYANGSTPVLAQPEKPVPNGPCAG
jgi:uncharacterized membrane protein YfcA